MKKILNKFFDEIPFFGGIAFYLFVMILLFIIGETDFFLKLMIGLITIYFVTLLIRIVYFKPRPNREKYKNFIEKIDASSFPSVHASRMTFLFLFSTISFSLDFIVKVFLFLVFILGLYSRIYLKKHFFKDVFGGIILGGIIWVILF